MLSRHWIGCLTLFLFLSPCGAEGKVIYVNNLGGNDAWSGSVSQSLVGQGPVRTINRALALAEKGDHIVIANTGEPYRESIGLSAAKHCGYPGRPLVIDGNGAVLDGSQPVPPIAWQFERDTTFRFQPRRLGYQQLFLNGRPVQRVHIEPGARGVPKLDPLQWCVFNGMIYFAVEPDKTPHDYDLTYAALHVGITLYHVHDVAITNLKVQGFQLDGVNAHDGVTECVISDFVSRGNGRSGVCIAGSSQLELHGCLLGDNGTAQVYTEGLSVTSLVASEVLENTAPAFAREGGILFIDGRRRDDEKAE